LIVAVLVVAAAMATGYIIPANLSQPAPTSTAGAPIIKPIITPGITPSSAENEAEARDTVVWRDEAGAIYRAKVGGGRFDQFLRRRKGAIEAARRELRDRAATEIRAALKPVFAAMSARVPAY